MATVSNIECCGFTKAYKALTDSRKGCLSDCNLYSTALLQYQVLSLAEYTAESCLTEAQYNTLLQGLTLVCGCCSDDNVFDNPDTTEQGFCFFQAVMTDDNSFIGWEIDNEEFIPNLNSVMDTYDGRGETYSEDLVQAGAIITYYGLESDLPNPDIEDTNVDVPYEWSDPICEQTCWQYEFLKPDFIMTSINLGFNPTVNFLATLAVGQVINVQLGANLTLFETFLKGIYGPQVTVTSVTLPSTNIVITISGVYIPSTATVTGSTTLGSFTWNNISCP